MTLPAHVMEIRMQAHVCVSEQASKLSLRWVWILWLRSEHTRPICQLKGPLRSVLRIGVEQMS